MEEKLERLQFRPPAPELRGRILGSARAQASVPRPLYQRLLRSQALWISAAAALLLIFALHLFSVPSYPPEMAAADRSPETEALSKMLSEIGADESWLRIRSAIPLRAAPRMLPLARPTLQDLLNDLQ